MRPTPALLRAERYVSELVGDRPAAGTRLPTTAALAAMAGVSHVTMHRAVARLRAAGLVTTRVGSGIVVADAGRQTPPPVPVAPQPVQGAKWERVASAARADIVHGVFAAATTQPLKTLGAHYGVCSRTMRKVRDTLTAEGYLAPGAASFTPARLARVRGSDIVFVAVGNPRDTLQLLSTRMPHFAAQLEQQCARRNVHLDMRLTPGAPAAAVADDRLFGHSPRTRGRVQGYVVWASDLDRQWLADKVAAMARRGLPVVVIDEAAVPVDTQQHHPALGAVLTLALGATPLAGVVVGRYLARLGHRRVAYVYVDADSPWAVPRCQGLTQALCEAGIADAVLPVRIEASVLDPGRLARRLPALVPASGSALERHLVRAALRANAENLKDGIIREHLRRQVRATIEALPGRADIDCWVGDNDTTAVACLSCTERWQARRRPAVLGFDDSPAAAYHRLSSYNFGLYEVASTALHFVLHGAGTAELAGAVREVEGFVVARESCR